MKNSNSLRLIELLLVIAVAFGSKIFDSVCIELTQYQIIQPDATYAIIRFGSKIISDLAAIFLLVYILFRQGRNLSEIGFSFVWKDLISSILLAITAFIAYSLCWVVTYYAYYFATQNTLHATSKNIEIFKTGITFLSVAAMLVNPFYEELIVRAYTISEVKYLTNDTNLAIFLSVVIQSTYHLYQGFLSTWLLVPMFIIFSIYYIKCQRIMPVILAHMYFDLIALFSY
ncbi:MAG: CPBP family intramembrane glutamic endopeptidase [Heteroscytonema crispum UTEX LB 1556]